MYDRAALGRLLRTAREQQGLTITAVGAAVGVTCAYLSDIERGEKTIPPETLERIAEVLSLRGAAYRNLFRARERLPPYVEAHYMERPWPRRPRET